MGHGCSVDSYSSAGISPIPREANDCNLAKETLAAMAAGRPHSMDESPFDIKGDLLLYSFGWPANLRDSQPRFVA